MVSITFHALSFIFGLVDFFESKGAVIDVNKYKRELLDMDIRGYGSHRYYIVLIFIISYYYILEKIYF